MLKRQNTAPINALSSASLQRSRRLRAAHAPPAIRTLLAHSPLSLQVSHPPALRWAAQRPQQDNPRPAQGLLSGVFGGSGLRSATCLISCLRGMSGAGVGPCSLQPLHTAPMQAMHVTAIHWQPTPAQPSPAMPAWPRTHSAAAPCSSSQVRMVRRFRRSMAEDLRTSDFMRKATAPTPTAHSGRQRGGGAALGTAVQGEAAASWAVTPAAIILNKR